MPESDDLAAARSRALAHAYYEASRELAAVAEPPAHPPERTLLLAGDIGPAAVEARRLMRLAIWHRERSIGMHEGAGDDDR